MNKFINLQFTEEWGLLNNINLATDIPEIQLIELARIKVFLDNNKLTNTHVNELINKLSWQETGKVNEYIKKFNDYLKNNDLKKLFGGIN